MSTIIAVVKGISVVQEQDGRVHWQSGATIDADGANGQNGNPFAYRSDDTGLDYLANAGYPKGKWGSILIDRGDGKPLSDGGGVNWYSQTTYRWKGRPVATRFVDSTFVPYIVVNPHVRINAKGIVIGSRALVTYKGKTVEAVVADVSGSKGLGELSIAAGKALGFPKSDPKKGGVPSGVSFEFWPGQAANILGEIYELQAA